MTASGAEPVGREARRRRRRWLEAAGVVTLAVAGSAVLALASGAEALDAIGLALVGIAGVVIVCAVFYEIGAGEDEEREEQARLDAERRAAAQRDTDPHVADHRRAGHDPSGSARPSRRVRPRGAPRRRGD